MSESERAHKPVAEMTIDECRTWALSAPDREEAHRRREEYFLHHLVGHSADEKVRKKVLDLQKQIRALIASTATARGERSRLSFADMEIGEAIDAAFSPAKAA